MESPHYIYNLTGVFFNNSDLPHSFYYDSEYYDWYEFYDVAEDPDYAGFDNFIHYQKVRQVVLGILLVVMILVGLIGNILVIVVSCRRCRNNDSAFYVFLVNMCVASLVLLAFEYPLLLYENVFMQPWKMGKIFCQLHGYIQHCAFYGTAYALLLVLLFGVLQVTAPDKIVLINNTCAASVCCSIKWAVILIANIPTWIGHGLYDEIEGMSYCYHKQLNDNKDLLHKYLILHFIFAFAYPCATMVVLSTVLVLKGSQYGNIGSSRRLHRHTVIMLTGLILAFILCWGPTNIFILLLGFEWLDLSHVFPLYIISDIFMCLACANPSVNPWIIVASLRHELLPNRRQTRRDTTPPSETQQTNNNHSGHSGHGNLVGNGNIFVGEHQQQDIFGVSDTEMKAV